MCTAPRPRMRVVVILDAEYSRTVSVSSGVGRLSTSLLATFSTGQRGDCTPADSADLPTAVQTTSKSHPSVPEPSRICPQPAGGLMGALSCYSRQFFLEAILPGARIELLAPMNSRVDVKRQACTVHGVCFFICREAKEVAHACAHVTKNDELQRPGFSGYGSESRMDLSASCPIG